MPIKKSSLEQKWYYRMAKVVFLILPILILLLFLNGKINVCGTSQKSVLDMIQQNIALIIVSLVLYFLILTAIWKSFLYIAFGGLEDDTQKKNNDNEMAQTAKPAEPKSVKIVRWIAIIIILFAFSVMALSKMGYIKTSPETGSDLLKNPEVKTAPKYTCPATSAQTTTPCRSTQGGVGVSGVIVPDSCQCPSDTKFAQMDNITAGGPYKICTCK